MSADGSDEEEVADLSSPDVTTKYRTGGDITNKALQLVVEACVPDADIATLCELGDRILEEETAKVYNKKVKGGEKEEGKKIEKGVGFPTCISVNEVCGHFSPLKGESRVLKEGDVAKVSLSCHIDGFITEAAHTVLIGETTADDTRADVIHAAWHGAEAALRTLVVGGTNVQVTEVLGKVATEYGCKPLQGVLSHQLKKHVIDGNRVIIGAETPEMQVDEIEFEMNEVYSIDVVMSSGEGKARESETRTTVFKRQVENSYQLKTAKARQFISEVNRRFPVLPFTLRAIEEETTARVGITEAKRHELVEDYPVLRERESVFVAQFKFTALLLPGGTKRITGLPFGALESKAATTKTVEDEDLKKLLASSANPKKSKKKKAAAPKAGADAPAAEADKD